MLYGEHHLHKGSHMFYQKLTGLLNNFSYLIAASGKHNNIDILMMHISCHSCNDRDELYYIPKYTYVQENQKDGQSSGAAIYIANKIQWKKRLHLEMEDTS